MLGFSGKPNDVDGSKVDDLAKQGRIAEVSAYCETDLVNTYRIWLRYELFKDRLTEVSFAASSDALNVYIRSKLNSKPHLGYLISSQQTPALTFES